MAWNPEKCPDGGRHRCGKPLPWCAPHRTRVSAAAGLLACGSSLRRAFPVPQWLNPSSLAAYSCGGSCGMTRRRTAFPFNPDRPEPRLLSHAAMASGCQASGHWGRGAENRRERSEWGFTPRITHARVAAIKGKRPYLRTQDHTGKHSKRAPRGPVSLCPDCPVDTRAVPCISPATRGLRPGLVLVAPARGCLSPARERTTPFAGHSPNNNGREASEGDQP